MSSVTKYSLVGALNLEQAQSSATLSERAWEGAKATLTTLPYRICVAGAILYILPSPIKPHSFSFTEAVILYPLYEELVFRVGVHASLTLAQIIIQKVVPNSWKENRPFKFLMSPTTRVITGTAIFALAHLRNCNLRGLAVGIGQCSQIFLFPNEAIVYETHGLAASLTSHSVNNFVAYIPRFFK